VIPEHPFSIEKLTELMIYDRNRHPSKYSVVLVSEGAKLTDQDDHVYEGGEKDQYGHRKLGGIGDKVAELMKDVSAKHNKGHRVNVVNQRLGYLVRCGDPDALDSIVPMAYGNLALDLVLAGKSGLLVCLKNGVYGTVPVEVVMGRKKVVDVGKYYNTERLRPHYGTFSGKPLFVTTSD
jgi:6-phosphofructokinase 1